MERISRPAEATAEETLFGEALVGKALIVFATACKPRLRGIVSKGAGSLYRSGTMAWVKPKNRVL